MRLHTDSITPWESAASFGVAACVTVGATLLILGAIAPKFVGRNVPGRDVRRVSEHIEYVTPQRPAPPSLVMRRASRAPARPASQVMAGLATSETIAASPPDTAAMANVETPDARTPAPHATTGVPFASASVGFTRISKPVRYDSVLRAMTDSVGTGLTVRAIKPPPPTQAEIDATWRDEAFEAAAAEGSGRPILRKMVGASIPVPLPFGGPSRKQRERDRAIEAELKVMRAQRQARIDSIVATRRRRADSLARAANRTRIESH